MNDLAALIIAGNDYPAGSSQPAHQLSIHGKIALRHSVDILGKYCAYVCILETHKEGGELAEEILSVATDLATLPSRSPKFILLHDASRPLLFERTIEDMTDSLARGCPLAIAGSRIEDTLWLDSEIRCCSGELSCLQTPEGLSLNLLVEMLHWRRAHSFDSASPAIIGWNWRRLVPKVITQMSNPKITLPEDLASIEGVLKFGQPRLSPSISKLRGLHVLVLGGSGGIGQACLRMLEEAGATFHAPSRRELDLSRLPVFEDLRCYHAVLHSAGAYEGTAEEITRVNFLSCVDLLACAERTEWTGSIVFISSSSSTWGRPGIPYYSASKAALNALVEAESGRLASKGILINAIAPGKVDTRLQATINPNLPTDSMITPEYVARAISSYLSTTISGKITYIRKGFDH
jgi:NAD(P)-dependent dehydrogenase (short-subunit alcohol dehydrogenase family)